MKQHILFSYSIGPPNLFSFFFSSFSSFLFFLIPSFLWQGFWTFFCIFNIYRRQHVFSIIRGGLVVVQCRPRRLEVQCIPSHFILPFLEFSIVPEAGSTQYYTHIDKEGKLVALGGHITIASDRRI